MGSLIDKFGRHVSYLRLSVTDRCDLRCTYCMAERMVFLPRSELLTLEELSKLSHHFIDKGIRKIRITGGEPLLRRDIISLFEDISPRLKSDLSELTLTTNATQLSKYADRLARIGLKRINVSLDSLNKDVFAKLSRRNVLKSVLEGLQAAKEAGLKIKINTVLVPDNLADIPDMMRWAHSQEFDMSLIEIMPMGQTGEDRRRQFIPMQAARSLLEEKYNLTSIVTNDKLGGPARYYHVSETNGRIGFISPLTQNFCTGCNRIRMTCTGRIYMCLGQEDHIDLRHILRSGENLDDAIYMALQNKPKAHDFLITKEPSLSRHMSVTGG